MFVTFNKEKSDSIISSKMNFFFKKKKLHVNKLFCEFEV